MGSLDAGGPGSPSQDPRPMPELCPGLSAEPDLWHGGALRVPRPLIKNFTELSALQGDKGCLANKRDVMRCETSAQGADIFTCKKNMSGCRTTLLVFLCLRPAMTILAGSTPLEAACNAVLTSGVSCSTQNLPGTIPLKTQTCRPSSKHCQTHSQSACNKSLGLQLEFCIGPHVHMSCVNYHDRPLHFPSCYKVIL